MPFGSHLGISRRLAGLACFAGLSALAAGSPAGAQLQRFYEATGAVSISVNAGGSTETVHQIVIDKPTATAQVVRFFVMATSRDGRVINPGDVTIAGQPITWNRGIFVSQPNFPNFAHNVQVELTATIGPLIDAADPGPFPLVFTEAGSSTIEGEVVVVVFADPVGQPIERTVWLAFGGPSPEGDELVVNLKDPIDPEDPEALVDFGLGIASSLHGDPDRFATGRFVLVNDAPLTSAAGGQDDGSAAFGSLITVGGRGDDNANPADPLAPPRVDPRFDDELYSLLPFLDTDTTQVRVATFSEGFDNLFFAYFVLSDFGTLGSGVFLDPETAVNEVGSDHTVTATAIDSEGMPAPGIALTFAVIDGPNEGDTALVTTGADGTASFTYTGDGGTGTDAIIASFVDVDQQPIGSNIAVKQWISTLEIALTPETSVNAAGEDHTVVATVTNEDGVPQADVEVSFEVLSGPNAGTTGTVTTDTDGIAAFTYTGLGGAGVDEIEASLVDAQGNTVRSNVVTKEWVTVVEIALAPEVASALVGARHTVSATATDADAVPQPGIVLSFEIVSGPNAGLSGAAVTGTDGTASFTYTGLGGEGLDAIEASFVDALDVTRTSNLATVEWQAPPLEDPRPDLASSEDDEILVVREIGTGLTGILAERLDEQGNVLSQELLTDGDAVYSSPSVARLPNGLWVAVYLRGRPRANAVVGRFIGNDGLPAGDPLVIDETAEICDLDPAFACPLSHPDVAGMTSGLVVVWEREGTVRGRIFDGLGTAVGSEITVGGSEGAVSAAPEVAVRADENFVVAYESLEEDSSEIRLARYNARGAFRADVAVNLFTGGLQARPAVVAAPPNGRRSVILWESFSESTGAGIFGRVNPEAGVRPEFQVNSSIGGDQLDPALTVEPSGLLAAAWLDAERGVLAAQRFSSDLVFVDGELDLAPSVLLGSDAADPVLGRPRAVSLADGTLAVVAGIAGDDSDPDGGAAVAFTRPTPLAVCFEDGRLVTRTSRLECVKLRFQNEKRIRHLAGSREQ